MRALHSRGQDARQHPEQVTFPGDEGLGGQDAPDDAAVEEEGEEGGQDGPDAAFVPAARHQVAEVSEDQDAGPDVVGKPPEEPQRRAAAQDDEQGGGQERLDAAQRHEAAEHQERHGIEGGVAHAAMDEWAERDADQSREVARQDAEHVELAAGQEVHPFYRPDEADGAQDQEGAGFDLSNHDWDRIRFPTGRHLSYRALLFFCDYGHRGPLRGHCAPRKGRNSKRVPSSDDGRNQEVPPKEGKA